MTAPVDAAAYLRTTAKLIRERADAAIVTRWETAVREDDDSWQVPLVQDVNGSTIAECSPVDPETPIQRGRWDAEHIASWDPTVAQAVADWLDEVAEFSGIDDGAHSETRCALAVARAYRRDLP